jgi:arylsulfatase A-like enzyme
MLTDVLKEAGYHTRFVTDDSRFSYMVPAHNFDEIFQPAAEIRSFAMSRYQPYFRPFFQFLHGPLGWALVDTYRHNQAMGITHRPDAFAEEVANQISEAATHEKFFMAVHVCALHAPADRPWPYHQMYKLSNARGRNRFRYRSTGSKMADGDEFTDKRLARLESLGKRQNNDLYDSGFHMIEETWKRIEEQLRDSGLLENTLVIVLSDHGEEFYEGDDRYQFRGPNHGFHPWGVGQHHVLLGVRGTGFEPGRIDRLTSLTDIAETVALYTGVDFDSAGIPLQEDVPADRILLGETGASEQNYWAEDHATYTIDRSYHRYTVDPETLQVFQRPEYDDMLSMAKDHWAITRDHWLVSENLEDGPRYSLFRWRDDRLMKTDLQEEEAEVFAALRAHLGGQPMLKDGITEDELTEQKALAAAESAEEGDTAAPVLADHDEDGATEAQ